MTGDVFTCLTWHDLELWAGVKIVLRGRSYQRSGYVKDLCITAEGALIAWVKRTDRYATEIWCENGKLSSACTCPYGTDCKHAVAVVLEYLETIKKGFSVPIIETEDPRPELIQDESVDDEEDFFDTPDESVILTNQTLRHLKTKSKKELLDLLSEIMERYPEIENELSYHAGMDSGSTVELVKTIHSEINRVTSEPAWYSYRHNTGYLPDYSRVKDGLMRLLDEGHADEVVKLGKQLFRKGIAQIEQSNDEGMTLAEISDSLTIVFRALEICSLPDVKKLELAVDYELNDSYELCHGLREFWMKSFDHQAWSELADKLLNRLNSLPEHNGKDSFFRDFYRDNLTDIIIRALERAGRKEEIIPLYEQEAEITHSYVRLEKRLRDEEKVDEAESWIRKGIQAVCNKWPGIESDLREALLEIRRQREDWVFVASLIADDFFISPSMEEYRELEKAADQAGVHEAVRLGVLQFLETGQKPSSDDTDWPLPKTELPSGKTHKPSKSLLTLVRIEISMQDNDIEKIVQLYEATQTSNTSFGEWDWTLGGNFEDKIAQAVSGKYPDVAVGIWKRISQRLIDQAKPQAYQDAAFYMKKLQKLLKSTGREQEWSIYLEKLRKENLRKRKLLEVLDSLSEKPILESN